MKKILVALAMSVVMFTSSIALAAYEETIEEDADLTKVNKIAVAFPNYNKMEDKEPSIIELTREIYQAGKENSTREIISYDDVAAAIRRDTGIDIYKLDVLEAEKIYNANIAKYADSYLVATFANNSGRPWIFYYIYNAADQKLMYAYSIQSKLIGKNTKDYRKSAENFYKQFDNAATENLSKEDRKKAKEKQKELKAKKRNIKKITYKTGSAKLDKVKKK